jgi:hypothetical protein
MNRLREQIIILNSIADVRDELKAAVKAGAPSIVTIPIMQRLTTLYCLLDIGIISEAIEQGEQDYPKAA